MQRPHRGPAPRPVPHPPRRQPLRSGALTAPQNLRRTPEGLKHAGSALHDARMLAAYCGQRLVGGPAMPPRAAFCEQSPRVGHCYQPGQGDAIPLAQGACGAQFLVPQGIRGRDRHPRPVLSTRPQRHPGVGIPAAPQREPRNPRREPDPGRRQRGQIKVQLAAISAALHMRAPDDGRNTRARPRGARFQRFFLVDVCRTPARPRLRRTMHTRFQTTTTQPRPQDRLLMPQYVHTI